MLNVGYPYKLTNMKCWHFTEGYMSVGAPAAADADAGEGATAANEDMKLSMVCWCFVWPASRSEASSNCRLLFFSSVSQDFDFAFGRFDRFFPLLDLFVQPFVVAFSTLFDAFQSLVFAIWGYFLANMHRVPPVKEDLYKLFRSL